MTESAKRRPGDPQDQLAFVTETVHMIDVSIESIQSDLHKQRALLEDLFAAIRETKQELGELTALVEEVRGVVEDARTEARVARLRTE